MRRTTASRDRLPFERRRIPLIGIILGVVGMIDLAATVAVLIAR
jgi:hypothetical protein